MGNGNKREGLKLSCPIDGSILSDTDATLLFSTQ